MSTAAPEYLTTLRNGFADAAKQWVDQSTAVWDQWSQAWAPAVTAVGLGRPGVPGLAPGHRRGHGHQGEHDCGCSPGHSHDGAHGCEDACCRDACDCCVPDADVVVHARAGEVRVVPFRLHNPWRREREVSLELGPWHGCSGDDLDVRAVLEEDRIVLKPCEDRVVRLLITTGGRADDGSSRAEDDQEIDDHERAGSAANADAARKSTRGSRATGRQPVDVVADLPRRATDVEACASAYADVRFEGCARPQRVAVVVLPAECDAVDVGCDCGCCC